MNDVFLDSHLLNEPLLGVLDAALQQADALLLRPLLLLHPSRVLRRRRVDEVVEFLVLVQQRQVTPQRPDHVRVIQRYDRGVAVKDAEPVPCVKGGGFVPFEYRKVGVKE